MPMQTVDSMSYLKTIPRTSGDAFKDSDYCNPVQIFPKNKSGLEEPLTWIVALLMWGCVWISPTIWRFIAAFFHH